MNKRRYLVIVGVVAAVVVLAVLFDVVLANHKPVITNLAVPDRVVPKGTREIMCVARDPDGDALSYNWSASGGDISGTGAAINWTAPDLLGSYNVTVTVTDGRGGEATDYRTVEVRANRAPTISSLVADVYWTLPSGSIEVTCTASDPDGDELTYEWTASTGGISGRGAVVNWTAPREVGVYNVTVGVKDSHASGDVMFVPLSVDLGTPPTIEKLVVTPQDSQYLRESPNPGCDFDAWKNKKYSIECIALNTSGELFYDWSSTDGEIAGEGSNITWTAPNKQSTDTLSVKVTVTSIVSDDGGNIIAHNMAFYMASCTCGSWGLKSGEISF